MKTLFTLVTAAAMASSGLAYAQGATAPERYVYYPQMMGWWGEGWAGMVFGPLIMLLVLGLGVALVVALLRRGDLGHGGGGHGGGGQPPRNIALDLLKERFARGEIDQQEYEARRRVLSE